MGLPLSYNLAVLLTFAIAGAGLFRVARRLGVSDAGAALAALAFAFAPPRFCRAYGHFNLLGLGILGFAIEGLILTGAPQRRSRLLGALEATLALGALLYTDFYLALLGGLAAGAYGLIAWVRERTNRTRRISLMAVVAAGALAIAAPHLLRANADRTVVETGHPSKWCSVAFTSPLIPARVQVLSVLTRPLTERNHQNLVEGVGYLGWLPLFATAWVVLKDRPRAFDFALVSGGIALVLALGPQLRIFDRLLDVPRGCSRHGQWERSRWCDSSHTAIRSLSGICRGFQLYLHNGERTTRCWLPCSTQTPRGSSGRTLWRHISTIASASISSWPQTMTFGASISPATDSPPSRPARTEPS
jgi:hypothetical protein